MRGSDNRDGNGLVRVGVGFGLSLAVAAAVTATGQPRRRAAPGGRPEAELLPALDPYTASLAEVFEPRLHLVAAVDPASAPEPAQGAPAAAPLRLAPPVAPLPAYEPGPLLPEFEPEPALAPPATHEETGLDELPAASANEPIDARGWARLIGLGVGLTLVLCLTAALRIPVGTGVPATDVVVSAAPTGELELSRSGALLNVTGFRGGSRASARFTVRNQTHRGLAVRIRALPSSRALDRALQVDVRSGATTLYRGTLGGFRRPSAAFALPAGATAPVLFTISLPHAAAESVAGRVETVALELQSTPEES